jgi:hypothetical protein
MDKTNAFQCCIIPFNDLWNSVLDKFCRYLLSCIKGDSFHVHGKLNVIGILICFLCIRILVKMFVLSKFFVL